MDIELYCFCCGEQLEPIDDDTVECLNCGITYDIDDLEDEDLEEDDNSIPDCIWEDMVLSDPDLRD